MPSSETKKQPTPRELRQLVIEDVRWMAGPNTPAQDLPGHKLDVIYGLTGYQRRALASPFEESARKWDATASINRGACEKLSTLAQAVKLVSTAAGFDGSW
jgi:hypothetical protein